MNGCPPRHPLAQTPFILQVDEKLCNKSDIINITIEFAKQLHHLLGLAFLQLDRNLIIRANRDVIQF